MNQPDRDPRMRVIDVAYTGLIPYDEQKEAEAGDDAEDAGWFGGLGDQYGVHVASRKVNVE